MSVQVKYSSSFKAKKLRIKKLPKMMPDMVQGLVKRDLIEIKQIFHDGIIKNTFNLEKLSEITIQSKARKGYSRPTAPLYGKGDAERERSYANMLMIVRGAGGTWKLVPSNRKHWSKKLTLKQLFIIHEHGAKIKVGDKIIQIPPRPALMLAYRRWLIRRRRADKAKEVRKAMTEFINTGNKSLIKNITDFKNREK